MFKLTKIQMIAVGFLFIILCGTVLLMLPVSSRSGSGADFLSCLFTATSATCVTGLVVADTYTYWSMFGQLVILAMIQVGGLGFVTIGVTIMIMMGKRVGLSQRGLLKESVNTREIGGLVKLTKLIIKGTVLFELAGAVLFSIRFIPEFGFLTGIYYGIFHSISAFCNAGFDLMGRFVPYSSFVKYADDPIINFTTMALITLGGLGFVVWGDIWQHKTKFKKYNLHTKMVLFAFVLFVFGGAALFLVTEKNGDMAGCSLFGKIQRALFASVTPRTAGFNTIDVEGMSESGKLLTMGLMLIGGNPGSTAGGVKTTTVLVLFCYIIAMIRRTDGVNIFGRRLEAGIIEKAAVVFVLNLTGAVTAAFIICCIDDLPLTDILLETFSAVGTVGMSTGVTRRLGTVSRIVIILLMYCGRIGSLTFALAFTDKRKKSAVKQPMEKINIG